MVVTGGKIKVIIRVLMISLWLHGLYRYDWHCMKQEGVADRFVAVMPSSRSARLTVLF